MFAGRPDRLLLPIPLHRVAEAEAGLLRPQSLHLREAGAGRLLRHRSLHLRAARAARHLHRVETREREHPLPRPVRRRTVR